MEVKDLIITKIRCMEAERRFLEFVWAGLSEAEKVYFINNYVGDVPEKFTKK